MVFDRLRSNLAADHTSFVGRAAAVADLSGRLDRDRAVTLVGDEGVGKTRTAKEVARDRASTQDAVAFVDLSAALDGDDVLRAVASALELALSPDDDAGRVGALFEGLGRTLLVLDNFEHLAHSAQDLIAGWLGSTERACFLITSRRPLGLEREAVYPLESLRAGEAMALFESRARMVRYDFAVHARNRDTVAEIVERLARLPLAIELAAAQTDLLAPDALLARLRARADHLTLDDAIEWSWHLLTPWERSALAQCSVFRGGFDLIAAEQVLDLSEHPGAPRVLDVIRSLRTKGLLRSYSPAAFPSEVRFDLYESVRAFAWDTMAGDVDRLTLQHARRYLAVARAWSELLDSDREARGRADLETDNLLAAQRRTEARQPTLSAQLGLALDRVLPGRSPYRLRRSVLDRAVGAAAASGGGELLGTALLARGNFERALTPSDEALADITRAAALASDTGARVLEGEAILAHAKAWADRGELDRALEGYRSAQTIFEAEHARRQEGEVIGCLGNLYFTRGQLDRAAALFARALELHRASGNVRGEGITLSNLAALCEERGSLAEARGHYRSAQDIHQRIGNRRSEGIVLTNLGNLYRREGRFDEARSAYREALGIHREVRNRRSEAIVLGCLGALAIEEHTEAFEAARGWLEAAITLSSEVGAARSAGIDRVRLAIVDHLEGDLPAARAGLIRAIDDLEAIGDRRHAALGRAHLGAVLAELGSGAEALRALEAARTTLLVLSDVHLCAVVEILAAALDTGKLATLVEAERAIPTAEARIAELTVKRMLIRARARLEGRQALMIGPEARWFRIAEREVSLERRRNLRLIVEALARLRSERPGAGIGVRELFAEAWPGVIATSESSAHRVYVAIAELRRMGLAEILVAREEGYLFDPAVRLIRN